MTVRRGPIENHKKRLRILYFIVFSRLPLRCTWVLESARSRGVVLRCLGSTPRFVLLSSPKDHHCLGLEHEAPTRVGEKKTSNQTCVKIEERRRGEREERKRRFTGPSATAHSSATLARSIPPLVSTAGNRSSTFPLLISPPQQQEHFPPPLHFDFFFKKNQINFNSFVRFGRWGVHMIS
jgi:hypothetical protein